jgi:LPXTG-motif cell wall-anchored protein
MKTFRNSVRGGLVLLVCVVSFGAFGLNSSTMAIGVWGIATRAEFADGVQASRSNAYFVSVSCASAGHCTAVGRFKNVGGNYEAFTMTSTDGVWGQGTPAVFADGVANTDEPQAIFESVSCASAGHCTAVGKFRDESGSYQAFAMTSTDGVWGQGTPVVFADGLQGSWKEDSFSSVSCASTGDCTAVGYFTDGSENTISFTMTSTDGVWGQGTPAVFADGVLSSNPIHSFESVSCASAGHCTAVGQFRNVDNGYEAFTMTSTDGEWGQATPAVFADGVQNEDPTAAFYSVSCASAGHCTAVGRFKNVGGNYEAFTMTSTDGVWGQGTPAEFADGVQGEYKGGSFYSVSCGSVGNCSAVGYFANVDEDYEALTMTSTNGVWGQATPVVFADGVQGGPNAESLSVSCGSVGNCAAVGFFTDVDSNNEAFTMMSTYTPPAETTTTVAATTTTVAATTTTVVAAALLPATGSDSNGWLVAAVCAVITGTVLITRHRRIN